jgi:TRAP-type C4-dicarboxylate transport system permease small subunit
MLSRLSDLLNRISEIVCCGVLLAMTLVVVIQVVCRYFLAASLTWSEEFARYSLVWITFLGGSIAVKKRAHMGLHSLVDTLPPKAQHLVETLTLICIMGFLSIATLKGFQLALFNMAQYSPAMGISIGIVYFAVPSGSILMLVHVTVQLTAVIRSFQDQEARRTN